MGHKSRREEGKETCKRGLQKGQQEGTREKLL